MNRKLTYVIATTIFALALAANPTKAHASFNSYLTIDGGGGNSGSSSSGVGGSTLTGWFVQFLDSIGVRGRTLMANRTESKPSSDLE